jgi:hypothetical protein
MSQEKYNELFTPSELYVARRYASAVKIFLINALFLPLIPWATAIGILGLSIQFYIDKFLTVKHYCRP